MSAQTYTVEHDHALMYRCGSACPVVIERERAEATADGGAVSTRTRPTTDELYAQIDKLTEQAEALEALPDSVEYWTAQAGLKDRERNLWRQIGDACGSDVPGWARLAAYHAGGHCSDQADRYRQYARDVATKEEQ